MVRWGALLVFPAVPPRSHANTLDAAALAERLEELADQLAAVRAAVEALPNALGGGAYSDLGALTVDDAGAALGVGRSTVYELIKSGHLRPIKINRRTLVPVSQVRALLRHGTSQ